MIDLITGDLRAVFTFLSSLSREAAQEIISMIRSGAWPASALRNLATLDLDNDVSSLVLRFLGAFGEIETRQVFKPHNMFSMRTSRAVMAVLQPVMLGNAVQKSAIVSAR